MTYAYLNVGASCAPNPETDARAAALCGWFIKDHLKPGMRAREVLERAEHEPGWQFFPHGFWTEADGAYVVFDQYHRPLCRKRAQGAVEIVRSNAKIDYIKERLIYGDEGPSENIASVRHCFEMVERLGLRDEIEYRIAIGDARGLPGGDEG